MTKQSRSIGEFSVNRRSVLKAAGAAGVGVAMFSGTAAATRPRQVNFCGCSQVCVDIEGDPAGPYWVVLATEDEGGFEYTAVRVPDPEGGDDAPAFCYEVDDGETKIIGVLARFQCGFRNPGQCARKALDQLGGPIPVVNGTATIDGDLIEWQNEGFGTAEDNCRDSDVDVEIVHGGCGQPGRNPGGPPERRGR